MEEGRTKQELWVHFSQMEYTLGRNLFQNRENRRKTSGTKPGMTVKMTPPTKKSDGNLSLPLENGTAMCFGGRYGSRKI